MSQTEWGVEVGRSSPRAVWCINERRRLCRHRSNNIAQSSRAMSGPITNTATSHFLRRWSVLTVSDDIAGPSELVVLSADSVVEGFSRVATVVAVEIPEVIPSDVLHCVLLWDR